MLAWKDVIEFASFEKVSTENAERVYNKFEVVWTKIDAAEMDCLYIVKEEELSYLPNDEKIAGLVIILNKEDTIENLKCNYGIIKSENAAMFYENVKESFLRQKIIREKAECFLQMVSQNTGLQKMVNEMSDWLDRPIAIIDNTYRFLVKSRAEELDSYVDEKDRGIIGVTQERLQMLLSSGILSKSVNINHTEYFEIDDFTIYHVPLYVNNVKVAALGIPGNKKKSNYKLPKEYIYELDKIGRIFSLELAKTELYSFNGKKNLPYVFSYVLEQEPTDFEYIKNRMKLFEYDLLPNMYLISIPIKDKKEFAVQTIADSLKRVFTNSIYLIRQQEIVFLVSRPKEKEITEFELDIWDNQLKSVGLYGGLSSLFQSFVGVKTKYLKEAHLALEAGKKINPDKNLYVFEEYQIDALLVDVKGTENLTLFCYPALMRLKQYDEEKNSELVTTLKAYLRKTKKPKEVCDELYIHKNTLYKRLVKIEQIMECDLTDPETIMRIQLTFHILDII